MRKKPKGKGPTVVAPRSPSGDIPETWLGGYLRAGSVGAKWRDVLRVFAEVGTSFPDLGDFAIQADLVLTRDPRASCEEILEALNTRREDSGSSGVTSWGLIGQVASALALMDRAQSRAILSAGEPGVARALVEAALLPEGTKDRENFLQVQGLLKKGQGVSVKVDNSTKSVHLGGGVEEDNREFQRLMSGEPLEIEEGGDEG